MLCHRSTFILRYFKLLDTETNRVNASLKSDHVHILVLKKYSMLTTIGNKVENETLLAVLL